MENAIMKKENPILALVMMVKNEKLRIHVSLESVVDFVDKFIILDTGSTDNTKEIISLFCKKHNKTLHMIDAPFVDFSTSRNVLLDYAEDKADYLFLLDCNDELKNGELLRKFVNEYTENCTGFHICQEWFSGQQTDKYFNIRLVKTHPHKWRYKSVVHEYITCPEQFDTINPIVRQVFGFSIFQDRTKDDDKSFKRFTRDKELLYQEYLNDKYNPRTLFYLGQTCMCLRQFPEAFRYYNLRTKQTGFTEEIFHSYLRNGELAFNMKHSWEECFMYYQKAFEYSCTIFKHPRLEPLIKLTEYYIKEKNWQTAFLYARRGCELPDFPHDAVLFVNKHFYDYTRWHLLSIVSKNIGEINLGKICCVKAIEKENKDIDKEILKTYCDQKEYDSIIKQIEDKKNKIIEKEGFVKVGETVSIKNQNMQNKVQENIGDM